MTYMNHNQYVNPSDWLTNLTNLAAHDIVLFCLPYAGGDVSVFNEWQNFLPSFIKLCPVKLPGRGRRLMDVPYTNIHDLAREISGAIKNSTVTSYALFGHSMGALISYEIVRNLHNTGYYMPKHLFISACSAPPVRKTRGLTLQLSDEEFLLELRQLKGTPDQFFDNSELMSLLLPTLRADFQACETYMFHPAPPLPVDLCVFGGKDDVHIKYSDLNAWHTLVNGRFRLETFSGDHFFLHRYKKDMLNIISTELRISLEPDRT